MLIFWAGWQPEMSLWESGSTNGWLGENTKPPVRIFDVFLMSQVSAMGQRRYDPCPQNTKSVQQCIEWKMQVLYRIWVPGTGFSAASHSAATLSKCVTPYKIQSMQRSFKDWELMSHRHLGGWRYVGSDFNPHCFFSIQNTHNLG